MGRNRGVHSPPRSGQPRDPSSYLTQWLKLVQVYLWPPYLLPINNLLKDTKYIQQEELRQQFGVTKRRLFEVFRLPVKEKLPVFTQPHIQWSQRVLPEQKKGAGKWPRGGGETNTEEKTFQEQPHLRRGDLDECPKQLHGNGSGQRSNTNTRPYFTCSLQDITKTEHTSPVPAQSIRTTTPTCQLLHKCKSPGCSCATCMTALTQPLFAVKTAHIYCRNVCQILIKLLHVALTQCFSNPHQAPPRCSNPVFQKLRSANGCQGVRETKIRNGGRVLLAVRNLYVRV